jgi:molybdate transport system substrate-binding protein
MLMIGVMLAITLAGPAILATPPVSAQSSIDCSELPVTGSGNVTPEVDAITPGTTDDPVPFPDDAAIMVFAAASLTDAFTQIGEDISEAHPGVSVEFNFAGSQALVTQLSEGAEADVFASANLTQMESAVDAGVIDGTVSIFARNHLVVIVPEGNPAGLFSPADLGKEGILLDIAQEDVPVGRYTRQSVCLMDQDTETFGEDFAGRVSDNIVSEENNVRAVVTKVALGEADAGVVYQSDVTPDVADQVEIIEIPEAFNVVAEYPVAAVAGGDAALSQAFIDYLLGPEGQATLEEHGFQTGS